MYRAKPFWPFVRRGQPNEPRPPPCRNGAPGRYARPVLDVHPRYGPAGAKALRKRITVTKNERSDERPELAVTLPQLLAGGAIVRRRCSRLQPVDMLVRDSRSA